MLESLPAILRSFPRARRDLRYAVPTRASRAMPQAVISGSQPLAAEKRAGESNPVPLLLSFLRPKAEDLVTHDAAQEKPRNGHRKAGKEKRRHAYAARSRIQDSLSTTKPPACSEPLFALPTQVHERVVLILHHYRQAEAVHGIARTFHLGLLQVIDDDQIKGREAMALSNRASRSRLDHHPFTNRTGNADA